MNVMLLGFVLIACNEVEKETDDNEESPESEEQTDEGTSTEVTYPSVPLYDFAAAAPWYSCSPDPVPGEATIVTAFDRADQYFGSENLREIRTEVEFPETGDWAQVGMVFLLECPDSGLCDHWDRSGSVQLVQDAESESPTTIELLRQITPYRVGMCQYIDVTPAASLLRGKQNLASYIDTWVGPGHSQGEGWKVTVQFVFYPGAPAAADEVINIWGRRSITVGESAEGSTVADQIEEQSFTIPADATRVEAHLITTGHSFGNTFNCAEFCEMRHDVTINDQVFSVNPWRSDCDVNPVSPQYGTWEYPRNGWCPGGVAVGDRIDITSAVNIGGENRLNLDILLASGAVYNNLDPVELRPYTLLSLKLYVYK